MKFSQPLKSWLEFCSIVSSVGYVRGESPGFLYDYEMLTVTHYEQTKQSACGAYVLKMILEYWGIQENLDVLIEKIGVKINVGASHAALIKVLRAYKLSVSAQSNASVHDLEKYLSKSMPVIINYISPLSGLGHYSIVIGIEDGHVFLCDSSNGPRYSLDIEEFDRIWFNSNKLSKHWLAAPYPMHISK